MVKTNAEKMKKLFNGRTDAYGQFVPTGLNKHKNKVEGNYETVKAKVTLELWQEHLTTDKSIGIIPVKIDSTCVFGAIDVDDYELDHKELLDKVAVLELPLMMSRSKSGGAHLYCFVSEPVAAGLMQDTLKAFASKLGVGRSEIFPKQREINPETKHFGSFINVPYNKGVERPFLKDDGSTMTLEEFLVEAETHVVDVDTFLEYTDNPVEPASKDIEDEDTNNLLKNCLPCILNIMNAPGNDGKIPQGERNNWLFQYGVYAKQRWKISFDEQIRKFNQEYLEKPLPDKEVDIVIKSVTDNEYGFKCKDAMCADYCDRPACMKGKFGPSSNWFIEWGQMVKLMLEDPIYYWDINNHTVKLTSEDLTMPQRFKTALLRQAEIHVVGIEQNEFSEQVNQALAKSVRIKVNKANTKKAQLLDYLRTFCQTKSLTKESRKPESLMRNMVYHDVDNQDYIFVLNSFTQFLNDHNAREFSSQDIASIFKKDWLDDDKFTEKHQLRTYRFRVSRNCRPTVWSIKFPDEQNIYDSEEEDEAQTDN